MTPYQGFLFTLRHISLNRTLVYLSRAFFYPGGCPLMVWRYA